MSFFNVWDSETPPLRRLVSGIKMSWFPLAESFKKRACRFLLQHYLGQFFEHKIEVEQLSVDIYKGEGTISDVQLDVEAVNEVLQDVHAPFEVKRGFISSVSVTVPWSQLLSENCRLQINGLELTVALKSEGEAGLANMAGSMSPGDPMAASMKLAEDCIREEADKEETAQYEGVETLAKLIDSVVSRVKVKFVDTVIRIEHLGSNNKGIALELHVESLEYSDAVEEQIGSVESSADPSPDSLSTAGSSRPGPTSFAIKNINFSGVSLNLGEYSELEPCSSVGEGERHSLFTTSTSSRRFSVETSADEDDEGESFVSDGGHIRPIQVAQVVGEMKVEVKMKQMESLPGPKIEVLCSAVSVHLFLAPHQLHVLLGFIDAFMQDTSSVNTNATSHHNRERPMQSEDYGRVQQQLQTRMQIHQMAAKREKESQRQQESDPWALPSKSVTASVEDSVEEFYSFESGLPPLGRPPVSVDSEHLESISLGERSRTAAFAIDRQTAAFKSFGSVGSLPSLGVNSIPSSYASAGSYGTPSSQRFGSSQREDTLKDIAHYSVELGTVSVVLLESDLHTPPVQGNDSPTRQASEAFFEKLASLLPESGYGAGNVRKDKLISTCAADHIRISLNPVKVNMVVQMSSSCQSSHMELSVGLGEVLECLYGNYGSMLGVQEEQPSPLSVNTLIRLSASDSQCSLSEMQSACLKVRLKNMNMKKSQLATTPTRVPQNSSKTDVFVDVSNLSCELNVTLIDRVSDLLKPRTKAENHGMQPMMSAGRSIYYSVERTPSAQYQSAYHKAIDETPVVSRSYSVSVNCPSLKATVRFPVADLRPANEKAPWHRQTVRSQTLGLEFSEVKVRMAGCTGDERSIVDIQFKEMQGHYHMAGEDKPIHFLTVTYTQQDAVLGPRPNITTLSLPKISVIIQPNAAIRSELVGQTPEDSPAASMFETLSEPLKKSESSPLSELLKKSEPSPFSSKNVVYKDEQLVMPGSSNEMKDFEGNAIETSRYVIDISLPTVNIHMPSKLFYQDLYNRLCSDLLLWEPQCPQNQEVDHNKYRMEDSTQVPLFMCQSALRPVSDDEEVDSGEFKSAYQHFMSGDSDFVSGDQYSGQPSRHKQSLLSLSLRVRQGMATIITSAESDGDKLLSPEKLIHLSPTSTRQSTKHGEILFDLSNFHLFTVAGYQGNSQLQYLCLQSYQWALGHIGLVNSDTEVPLVAVDMSSSAATPSIHSTIYRSDSRAGCKDEGIPMLSLAMKVAGDKEANRKDVQLAVSINGATLRHRMMPPEQQWVTQLSDFFNVSEDSVPGYTSMDVITSLYIHLYSCMIDYRPLFLPLRAALTIGSFSLSSSIVYASPQSVLRLILNTIELHLSDKTSEKVDLRQDYVCVGDLGSFDLLLKTSSNPDYPSMVLEASNSQLNLWTCKDTFVAIRDLLQYLASDGDLPRPMYKLDPCVQTKQPPSPVKQSFEEKEKGSKQPVEERADKIASIDSLMASAVADIHNCEESEDSQDDMGLFSKQIDFSDSDDDDGLIQSGLFSGMSDFSTGSQDPEQDTSLSSYCIVEMPGGKMKGLHGVAPQVECFLGKEDSIRVIENHFSAPTSKIDLLHPPTGYPTAVSTYILKELSVTWRLFGGHDFGPEPEEKAHSPCPGYGSTKSPQAVRRKRSDNSQLRDDQWKQMGGSSRDQSILMEIELNKIRVRYDSYPETSDKSFRLAALIGDVEIRDRLASSQLNKFLYCYSSETMPRRSHASMVTFKLLCLHSNSPSVSGEYCLHVGILPIKLNIDQDALYFLKDFFIGVQSPPATTPSQSGETGLAASGGLHSPSPGALDASFQSEPREGDIVFKSFTFYPDLPLRIDYHGKRISIEQGLLPGLVTGLAQLSNSEVTLKQLCSKKRLEGFGELLEFVQREWMDDVRTQMTGILGGVGPMHSLRQIGQGIYDLFWMPIQQYRKDGRVVRGLQKGTSSFGTSTAMAAVELTNRLVQTVQAAAEMTYDFLSPANQAERRQNRAEQKRRYGRQPVDVREGVTRAYDVVAQGFADTATAISRVALEEHEQYGITGAVTGILKVTPGTAVQPIILATEAVSNVLGGVRNQFVPDAKREQEDKYRAEQN